MHPTGFSDVDFRRVCGQFLTGVTIVTAAGANRSPLGLTVNSVTSVSLDPPLVLFCLDQGHASHAGFRAATAYAIHVLSRDQLELSRRFAIRGADTFAGLSLRQGLGGAGDRRLRAIFECPRVRVIEAGDHAIFLTRVQGLDVAERQAAPLGFHCGRYVDMPASEALAPAFDGALETDAVWALGWA